MPPDMAFMIQTVDIIVGLTTLNRQLALPLYDVACAYNTSLYEEILATEVSKTRRRKAVASALILVVVIGLLFG